MARTTKQIIDDFRSIKGELRRLHFASGGTLAAWRGVHTIEKDRKAEMSKRSCRSCNHQSSNEERD